MDDDEHATSDVPDEWQGFPDYLLDEMESGTERGLIGRGANDEP